MFKLDGGNAETPRAKTNKRGSRKEQGKSKSALRALTDYFGEQWSKLVGGGATYAFARAKDGQAATRILKAVGDDVGWGKRIVDAYFDDDDAWIREHGEGRPLSLLASGPRLPKYIALTAPEANRKTSPRKARPEHHVLTAARARWPEDVAAYPDEYRAIAIEVEAGGLPTTVVKQSTAETGALFRAKFCRAEGLSRAS